MCESLLFYSAYLFLNFFYFLYSSLSLLDMKTKDDMILFKTKETNEINIQLELYQQQNSKLLNENNHLKHFNDSILIAENDLNQTKRKTHALESKLLQTNELMSSMNMDRLLLTEESVEMENINEGKYQSSDIGCNYR